MREAVEAAFAQTYSPLEIILSDDCSWDRTFELMRELAAAYCGPHRVVLNRNRVRRSIGGHLNKVMEMSRGELVVCAAGDDISLPTRAEATYEAWENSGRHGTSIHSGIIQIGEAGQATEQIFKSNGQAKRGEVVEQAAAPLAYVRTLEPLVFGCAHAFSRQLFRIFGDVPENVIHEDNVLAFRSVLAGRLIYLNEPLVKYRVHDGNVFIRAQKRGADLKTLELQEDRVRRDLKNRETMYEAFLLDLDKARLQGLLDAEEAKKVEQEARRRRDRFSLMGKFLESGFFCKCRILWRLRREGLDKTEIRMLVSASPVPPSAPAHQASTQLRCAGFWTTPLNPRQCPPQRRGN